MDEPSGQRRWTSFATLAVLALLTVPPTASLSIETEALGRPIVPAVESRSWNVTVTENCNALLATSVPQPPAYSVAMDPPDGIIVSGPGLFTIDPTPCHTNPAGTAFRTQTYVISASREAAGLVPLLLGTSVTRQSEGPLGKATAATNSTFQVGYFPLLEVTLPAKVVSLAPGRTGSFTLSLKNLGNAATTPTLAVDLPLQSSYAPIPSIAPGATVATVVNFTTPDEEGAHQFPGSFSLTPHASGDAALAGDPVKVPVLVVVRGGVTAALPSPAAPVAFTLLAWAAARRRHGVAA